MISEELETFPAVVCSMVSIQLCSMVTFAFRLIVFVRLRFLVITPAISPSRTISSACRSPDPKLANSSPQHKSCVFLCW